MGLHTNRLMMVVKARVAFPGEYSSVLKVALVHCGAACWT
jgi:hypothetical protein